MGLLALLSLNHMTICFCHATKVVRRRKCSRFSKDLYFLHRYDMLMQKFYNNSTNLVQRLCFCIIHVVKKQLLTGVFVLTQLMCKLRTHTVCKNILK